MPGQPIGGPADTTGQFGATQQVPAYPGGYGASGWQQPGPYGPKPPSRARRWVAAGAAAVVLVLAGGVVGGVTVHALDGNTPMESTVVSSPVSVKGGSLADMVKQVKPSVVSLKVQSGQSGDEGSGVIISTNGMIVTNNHVVEAAAGATVRSRSRSTTAARRRRRSSDGIRPATSPWCRRRASRI
ncbi:S1C family serine protease [Actinocatenispora thailandica]|uniref:S1C family serine protease n=1 Tax=Actinocatenispora thailandica TaxID=227318 RepID=UPI00194F2192|nr:S1C family serine protease [Actinocatenispora thailandica]